jgi:peptidoglycan/xylan/chitin deacetylase (PgdA/CDA1 family)
MFAALGAAAVLGGGASLAWRVVPWIDPLFRIRWRLPPSSDGRPRCAVTFDDGPSPGTAAILDALGAAGVRATFFVLARNAARYPELVRRAAAEGHTIGIHGTTHRTLTFASETDAEREIGGAVSELLELGVSPAPVYRPPHGRKSPATLRVLRHLGLQMWAWTRGLQDTRGAPPEELVQRAARRAHDRMVLLLHDGHDDEATPDVTPLIAALPDILALLVLRGFEFTTLDRV